MSLNSQLKKLSRTTVLCLCVYMPAAESKELLGVHLGATYWDATIQDRVQSADIITEDATLSATNFSSFEVGVNDDAQYQYFVELKHNLPMLPRARFSVTPITSSGSRVAIRDINLVDTAFPSGNTVNAEYDLSYETLTLYYSIEKGPVAADLGVSRKTIDGNIRLDTTIPPDPDDATSTLETRNTTAVIKKSSTALFLRATTAIASTPLQLTYSLNYINSGKEQLNDTEIGAYYQIETKGFDYRVEAGYKKTKFISDDLGDVASAIEVAGPYLSISTAF